ncbi:hypothetical protein HG535_0B05720 [Zygotorulaspora mrakii]|uniref:Phosphatidylethanolamine N-methyltransferase n=1 Tax=Zygotorulaspora mrakii TaxID=42260 RepID=A0A7H9B0N0_ZYGMR|nr:uncharacterized protein HG535_0B05720 [Zygotorulaspora mrakii]QLG71529.1 hypothetical protein HG535_0B05720 [Zygotorulaspora mrakii]
MTKQGGKGLVAETRSTGVKFEPPETHDMVRSLFDPTVKKSFLEICITLALMSNFAFCYWLLKTFNAQMATKVFFFQYFFWRLCYNVGIGIVLHYQSKSEFLTRYARNNSLFVKKSKSKLARFCQFELSSKMPKSYDMYSYPEELNIWLLFRQFVDLILMQDFCTYVIFVYLSFPESWASMVNWRTGLGFSMILFNIWVKIDAHRVVKDYAWYWGDFFFLQESELVFDGVFNISPHPMYSIGYLGYYGLSMICGDYRVLLVSLCGHYLQFLFLKYVESPHIEKIYGDDSNGGLESNSRIDDLIASRNYDYSRPLINTGFTFQNFDKLRFTDYFTLSTIVALISWMLLTKPSSDVLFYLTFTAKLLTSIGVLVVLFKQSKTKWFTRLYLKNGHTQVYSYQQWQFVYNFSLAITYTLLGCETYAKVSERLPALERNQFIYGLILCALQGWCNSEIRSAISDFGWFYGDFFLNNYITKKNITSHGIYRYLNNPEAILGVAGIWGTVLMTNFSWQNVVLASLWTLTNFILVKFIEQPHMAKIYGEKNRVGGIEKTLLTSKTWRRMSEMVEKVEHIVIKSLLSQTPTYEEVAISNHSSERSDSTANNEMEELESAVEDAIDVVAAKLSPNCKFEIEEYDKHSNFILPEPITITWELPKSLYNQKDWIGLYSVLKTGCDRSKTRTSSLGHWSATSPTAYPNDISKAKSIIEYEQKDKVVRGKVTFDASLLYFESGIYEFRYHCSSSHKVLLVSRPLQLELPRFDVTTSEKLTKDFVRFLTSINSFEGGRANLNGNKYFGLKTFRQFIKESVDVELSSDYIKRVNGDAEAIAQRICHIKKVLDSLE